LRYSIHNLPAASHGGHEAEKTPRAPTDTAAPWVAGRETHHYKKLQILLSHDLQKRYYMEQAVRVIQRAFRAWRERRRRLHVRLKHGASQSSRLCVCV
jgi:hypothetical protein